MSSALLALTAVSSDIGAAAAAPFPVNASAFRVPASNDRIDVRYRGGALAAGIVFGLIGAAIASQYYYYPSPYYYPAYPRAYYYPSYSYYTPYPYYTAYPYYPAWLRSFLPRLSGVPRVSEVPLLSSLSAVPLLTSFESWPGADLGALLANFNAHSREGPCGRTAPPLPYSMRRRICHRD